MNYKNDPLFRFLQANQSSDCVDMPRMSKGGGDGDFCPIEQNGAVPECESGVACCRSLAMVYSPYQHFEELYEAGESLCRGTLFRKLDKPFLASGRGL